MDDRTTGRPDDRTDQAWMGRALRLASLSLGMTWPNPGVGCVLVRGGTVIGEGRHRRCGELHAET
ncbi:MAG: riboflavin biosynthesis protein RibD, partial [Planctomycetes bacterium]|nr:riboflavin biosynthesis protein RibD [Planctomycetota bacterium]